MQNAIILPFLIFHFESEEDLSDRSNIRKNIIFIVRTIVDVCILFVRREGVDKFDGRDILLLYWQYNFFL